MVSVSATSSRHLPHGLGYSDAHDAYEGQASTKNDSTWKLQKRGWRSEGWQRLTGAFFDDHAPGLSSRNWHSIAVRMMAHANLLLHSRSQQTCPYTCGRLASSDTIFLLIFRL